MKAFYTLLIFIFFFQVQAFSQLLIGPKVGMNYSWTPFKNEDFKDRHKMEPVIGFHAGGHIAFKVRNRFFLHTSLMYSTKGRVIKGKYDTQLKSSARHNYIEMPINYTVDFKGKFGGNKEFKYFFGIGPNISYWLGGKGTFFNNDLEEAMSGELSYKIKFGSIDDQPENELRVARPNRLQLGLNFVAGLILEPAYKQRIMLSLHYELGHSYMAKSDGKFFSDIYYAEPFKGRNKGFRISLAYLIDLKTEERKKGKSTIDKRKLNKG